MAIIKYSLLNIFDIKVGPNEVKSNILMGNNDIIYHYLFQFRHDGIGYRFYILMTSFSVDIPHRSSKLRSQFSNNMNSTSSMNFLYESFQSDLVKKYGSSPSLSKCTNPKDIHMYMSVNLQ